MHCFKCKKTGESLYINVAGSNFERDCRGIHKDLIPEDAEVILYCEDCLKADLGLNENITIQSFDSALMRNFELPESSVDSVVSSQQSTQSAVGDEATLFNRPCPKRFKKQLPPTSQPESSQQPSPSSSVPQSITPRPGPKTFKRRMGWLPESGSKKNRSNEQQTASQLSFDISSQINSQPITQPSVPLRARVEDGSSINQLSQPQNRSTQDLINVQQVIERPQRFRFPSPPGVPSSPSSSGQSEPEVPLVPVVHSPPRDPNPPSSGNASSDDDDDDARVPVPNQNYIPQGAPHRPRPATQAELARKRINGG